MSNEDEKVLYFFQDKDNETVTLYGSNRYSEHPFIETLGDSEGAALPPLEAYKLASALIGSIKTNTGPDARIRGRILDDISTLIEDEEDRPLREARERTLAALGIDPNKRFTTETLHTLIDHIQTLKETATND